MEYQIRLKSLKPNWFLDGALSLLVFELACNWIEWYCWFPLQSEAFIKALHNMYHTYYVILSLSFFLSNPWNDFHLLLWSRIGHVGVSSTLRKYGRDNYTQHTLSLSYTSRHIFSRLAREIALNMKFTIENIFAITDYYVEEDASTSCDWSPTGLEAIG